jgi:hypothetical protein
MRTALAVLFGFLAWPLFAQTALPAPAAGCAYVYPSPATASKCANIASRLKEPGRVFIRLFNESGDLVARLEEPHDSGVWSTFLNTCSFSPGAYLFQVTIRYGDGSVEKLKQGWFTVTR